MPNKLDAARARAAVYSTLRAFFASRGYDEVETPVLVPAPGVEPHINPFAVEFVPETDVGTKRTLWLHTSPEFAMKRLLAEGSGPLFQICRVFRNGEISKHHNPEFTLLEFYQPNTNYHTIIKNT